MSSLHQNDPTQPAIKTITTAIVYPNAKIHVGWAWETLGADWLNRSLQLMGEKTYFVTGMDEHALKVQKAAQALGMTPKVYCDGMAEDIKKTLSTFGIAYDRFIRTSDEDHERVVQALVQRAFDRGDIYSAKYEGHYCEGCEAYYTEKDLNEGKCPAHKTIPKWVSEENYFFKLSDYQDKLLKLFQDQPDFLVPHFRQGEIVNFIQAGLKDFSVSRSTFDWGVPLPFDRRHIVYVWFDALVNYLTACGIEATLNSNNAAEASVEFHSKWPAYVHIIGKDVTRFHCIYWPAILMSLGIELPRQVFAHGYISINGERLSKSSGNTVDPAQVVSQVGADPFRYYLLAENPFAQDGNFIWDALIQQTNADLANDFGNLVNRTLSMCRKYFPDQTMQAPTTITCSQDVIQSFQNLKPELQKSIDSIEPSDWVKACRARSRVLNLYIDQMKPWALAKQNTPESLKQLYEVIYTLLEGIRSLALSWYPVLPYGMPKVFQQLGIEIPTGKGDFKTWKWGEGQFKVQQPEPIYPRLLVDPVTGEVLPPVQKAEGEVKSTL